jgi:hypothetical protein
VSKTADPLGDRPIRLAEHQFTLSDAAFLSGVPAKSIRNWIARDVLPLGHRHFLGRWLFSLLDILKLSVMHDLSVRLSFNPRDAARLAEMAGAIAMDSTARDASGQLLDSADGFRPNRNIVVSFNDDGLPLAGVADIRNPGNYYPPAAGNPDTAPLRRAHVVVPVTSIFHDMLLRTEALTRSNVKAEAPTHE